MQKVYVSRHLCSFVITNGGLGYICDDIVCEFRRLSRNYDLLHKESVRLWRWIMDHPSSIIHSVQQTGVRVHEGRRELCLGNRSKCITAVLRCAPFGRSEGESYRGWSFATSLFNNTKVVPWMMDHGPYIIHHPPDSKGSSTRLEIREMVEVLVRLVCRVSR